MIEQLLKVRYVPLSIVQIINAENVLFMNKVYGMLGFGKKNTMKKERTSKMENNKGLTPEQVRLLNEWSKSLWTLLDQEDFNNISKIFDNEVARGLGFLKARGYNNDK
jgi:hypothetical protein